MRGGGVVFAAGAGLSAWSLRCEFGARHGALNGPPQTGGLHKGSERHCCTNPERTTGQDSYLDS